MNRLSKYFLVLLSSLLVLLSIEILYMYANTNHYIKEKNEFVKLVGLPDLTISNGANFIRHRSYSDTFSLFSNGPELLEYFPSTFTYNYSHTFKKTPSRIELEH